MPSIANVLLVQETPQSEHTMHLSATFLTRTTPCTHAAHTLLRFSNVVVSDLPPD